MTSATSTQTICVSWRGFSAHARCRGDSRGRPAFLTLDTKLETKTMLVPISWLKEYIDLILPIKQLTNRLTLSCLEIKGIKRVGYWGDPELIVEGQIVAIKGHPNADRRVIVDIDYGGPETEQVVTGAPNLFQYKNVEHLPVLKVAFARAGAVLVDAYSDERPRPKKKLKPSKIRGISSNGMVCSERELGLSEEHEGILILPEDAPVGMPLRDYLGDEVLVLGLTVAMARCLRMIRVAREVAALTNAPLHLSADTIPTCLRSTPVSASATPLYH